MKKVLALFILISSFFIYADDYFDNKKDEVVAEFEAKIKDSNHELSLAAKKSFDAAKKIIIFPENVDIEKVILKHGEDIYFLTSNPHFIHKHVLVCTFKHNNDIRLSYDEKKDDFFFHTKESVKEKRLLADQNSELVYELDYFALREKKREPEADPDNPNFIILGRPTSLHPSFQRKGDGHYFVEIASGSRENKPTQSGNHNWIRLIDNEGKVFSVGMHPKVTFTPSKAYSKIPVRFFNSDVYEWIGERTFYTHTFPLSKDEFFSLKEEIESDMLAASENRLNFDYSIFEGNCCDWMIRKLARYLQMDTSEAVVDMYITVAPDLFDYYQSMSEDMKIILYPFIELVKYGAHIPRLVRAAVCGGFSVNEENPESEPFIKYSLDFLLNLDMHAAVHPYLFEKYLQNSEKELLKKRQKALEKNDVNEIEK